MAVAVPARDPEMWARSWHKIRASSGLVGLGGKGPMSEVHGIQPFARLLNHEHVRKIVEPQSAEG